MRSWIKIRQAIENQIHEKKTATVQSLLVFFGWNYPENLWQQLRILAIEQPKNNLLYNGANKEKHLYFPLLLTNCSQQDSRDSFKINR